MITLSPTIGKKLCECGREKDSMDERCLLCTEIAFEAETDKEETVETPDYVY